MKRRDRDKLRRLDPALASQLEEVLARRAAETNPPDAPGSCCKPSEVPSPTEPCECIVKGQSVQDFEEAPGRPEEAANPVGAHGVGPSLGEAGDPSESPEAPSPAEAAECANGESFAEGYQEPLLPPEAYEVDGQTPLLCGGSMAPPEAEDEPAEQAEVDALLEKLQRSFPFDDGRLPDCKRSVEELSLLTWQEQSTRREDPEFEHPAEFDAGLRALSDGELGEAWGWVLKRRYRGLSPRDEAVQREVYARCLGMLDLYGLDRQPAVSAMLTEVLRKQGCRSAVALYIVALLELMLVRGRLALRLSASDAYTLKGCAASTWWAAVARLEEMGILQRTRAVKSGEHGPAPVQRDTNLYVLGPWWFAGRKNGSGEPRPGTTPLEQALGLLNKCVYGEDSPAAAAAHRKTLAPRKARRRLRNTASRDRNRRRHRDLKPQVTTTPGVVRAADALARARQAEELAAADAHHHKRAQALLRGDLEGVGLGTGASPPSPELPVRSTEAAEAAAAAQVAAVNRGEPEGPALRREVAKIRGVRRVFTLSPSSELVNCRPVSGRQSRRGRPKEKITSVDNGFLPMPTPSAARTEPPTTSPNPQSSVRATKAGDKSSSEGFRGARARALDGERPEEVLRGSEPAASLQDADFVQRAFAACFGRSMADT